jgi:hypothetical protein
VANYRYAPAQGNWLSLCSHDLRVQPGRMGFGSPEYFDRARNAQRGPRSVAHWLSLEIALTLPDFFRWEPVELEITLRAADQPGSPSIEVPAELDAGYSRFVVWIEEPTGERRRYRSTKHYCSEGEVLRLEGGSYFRRDISIFGQSGGLTFRYPGPHRIWATLRLPDDGILRSNVVEFDIREERFRSKAARSRHVELRHLFGAAAPALFYRSGKMRTVARSALEAIVDRAKNSHLCSAAQYALGRWFAHQAHRKPAAAKYWLKKAKPYLVRASNSKYLDRHRRARSRDCLAYDPVI